MFRKITYFVTGTLLLSLTLGCIVNADGSERGSKIMSHGATEYHNESTANVYLNALDLYTLADEIDELEQSYKATANDALATIGASPNSDVWSDITYAIAHSQDVSTPATASNISSGKQAWVNGSLITGNGADVSDAYTRGYNAALASGSGSSTMSVSNGTVFSSNYNTAYVYAVTTAHGSDGVDGNQAGSNPVCTFTGNVTVSCILMNKYARNGFNVRVGLWIVRGIKSGDTYTGTAGKLIY